MYRLLILAALALPAHATDLACYSDKGATIALTDEPCKFKVSDFQDSQVADTRQLHRATSLFKGKVYEACWTPGERGLLYVMPQDDDRVYGMEPSIFKPCSTL